MPAAIAMDEILRNVMWPAKYTDNKKSARFLHTLQGNLLGGPALFRPSSLALALFFSSHISRSFFPIIVLIFFSTLFSFAFL
jgi:hypothetical protein